MPLPPDCSRRTFLAAAATATLLRSGLLAGAPHPGVKSGEAEPEKSDATPDTPAEPIIDIHQHTNYSGRTDEQLVEHQRRMGVTTTVLLPAGSEVKTPSTHEGKSNGLAANCGPNDSVMALARRLPGAYVFFANEVADLPNAAAEIEKFLKLGAVGIGELKFNIDCDSEPLLKLASLAEAHGVPMLLHFQYETYNKGYERFGKVLEKFPKVNFIGHAQTFWANIDKNHRDQKVLYPKTKVTPGGLTDRYLADYPNLYADLSAGSGLNSMLRDEDQARDFLARHQDKILYGSDCNDKIGRGPGCSGWLAIQSVRRLSPDKMIERKILHDNAKRLFKL